MKKKLLASVMLMCMVMMMCAMGCGQDELAEDYDKDVVIKESRAIVTLINEEKLETIYEEKFSAKMKTVMTKESWNDTIAPIIKELGKFEEFEKEAVTGTEDKDTKEEFATVVLIGKYENGKAQYTISFNKSMKVVGFFIK